MTMRLIPKISIFVKITNLPLQPTAKSLILTGKWIDSLLKGYQDALKGQKEVISAMQVGSYIAIKDLDSIKVLIDKLEIEISALINNVEFALMDEEAVKIGVEEVKKRVDVFMKSVEDLGEQADRCSREIRRARTVVLQRIIRQPN